MKRVSQWRLSVLNIPLLTRTTPRRDVVHQLREDSHRTLLRKTLRCGSLNQVSLFISLSLFFGPRNTTIMCVWTRKHPPDKTKGSQPSPCSFPSRFWPKALFILDAEVLANVACKKWNILLPIGVFTQHDQRIRNTTKTCLDQEASHLPAYLRRIAPSDPRVQYSRPR